MKERPILFSAPMVRAILDGRKTQTRRVVKLPIKDRDVGCELAGCELAGSERDTHRHCPYGQPGDRLRVKEHAWMFCERKPNGVTKTGRPKWHYVPLREAPVYYCEAHPDKPTLIGVRHPRHPDTGNRWDWRKKLGRFLPAWASRITLEVTAVRVERLHAITEADSIAEGIRRVSFGRVNDDGYEWSPDEDATNTARESFEELWKHINGRESWAANPYVWVVTFKRVEQP